MVDCGNTRCAQERRSFKKDLLSWSKKVPLLLGLEAIATELDDNNIVESLLDPLNCLEDNKVVDWEPVENCFYCQSTITFTFNVENHVSEDGEISRGPNDTDVKYLQELLPFCPLFYTRGAHLNATELLSPGGKIGGSPMSDDDSSKKPHVELKIPAIRQTAKLKRDSLPHGKKAYTEHELLAAVHDIRSGKIGTRRASVLYGIPRSTLRNKIFKMDNEQKNLNLKAENEADNLSEEPSARIERTMCLNDLMSQPSMFSFMPPLPFGLAFSPESNSKSTEEWEKKLEHIRKKHNLSGNRTEIYNGHHSVADVSDGKTNHAGCLPFNHELKLPILPELVKKLTEERLQMEHGFDHIRSSLKTSLSYNEPSDSSEPVQASSHSSVNLKIPSYKSVKAEDTIPNNIKDSKPYENSRIGETLKNIIAKTITEKVRSRSLSSSFESFQTFPGAPQDTHPQNQGPGSSAFSVPSASPPKRQKRCTDIPKKSQGSAKNYTSASPSTPVKKTRPKRGQYRKYNSQLLMEAVRAVQRGEMSVHRAGSYFGVPHSTLEYKVKERHLLRQKKIKEAQALKDSGNVSNTTSANSSDEEESNISPSKPMEEPTRPLSPTNQASASEWLKLYSSNIPPVSANNLAFYNSGFALNTPASELLRKLQHKVQSKANNYRGEDGFSAGTMAPPNGIGPLGGGFLFLN